MKSQASTLELYLTLKWKWVLIFDKEGKKAETGSRIEAEAACLSAQVLSGLQDRLNQNPNNNLAADHSTLQFTGKSATAGVLHFKLDLFRF